jgi:hypothetical protein
MRHVVERAREYKRPYALADNQPYRRFHKRNPNPSGKDLADAARAALRRQFTRFPAE